MNKRTLKMLLLITVTSSLFVGCGSKKTASTQTDETKSVNNTSAQAVQSTEVTKSTELTTAESTENTESTEQATEELVANNDFSAEPAPAQQLTNEVNQANNDNAQNDTSSNDSSPVQQPEPAQPSEPSEPSQPNNPNVIIIPDGGDVCPYETLKWTYYQGHFGFFWASNDPDIKSMDMQVALYPKGGTAQTIMVGSYRNTGVVQFLYNDEMNENTVVMP